MHVKRLFVITLFLGVMFGSINHARGWQAGTALDMERIKQATVYVIQVQTSGTQSTITCIGSGTIVDRSGLIAANAHNTVPNQDCPGTGIIIALSTNNDQPPVPTYRAEVAQANVGLDLALLRITQELNGRIVEPRTLSLPFVGIGDSSATNLDDTITAVGYPGIDSRPVALTRGTITGFLAEPSGGDRSWIKTDATIPGTMSGGGVYNQQGQLIGIPTTVPVTSLDSQANCSVLEDTNSDGLVNRNDWCVPVGGFINAVRPSNLIRPLVRSASLGLSVEKLTGSAFQLTTTETPSFSQVIMSPSVTQGMPTTVARSLPVGTNSLYLFFDYHNMTPETIYDLRVSIDGIPDANYSLAPVRWSGGVNGLWYIGIGGPGQVLPNGEYEFTLSINGLVSATNTILVGASQQEEPSFRNIFFCIQVEDNCLGDVYLLPTGNTVTARFVHRNLIPGETQWAAIWFYNDRPIDEARIEAVWQTEPLDTKSITIQTAAELPPGRYRLQLYIEGRLSALSEFTIAGASEGAFSRVFANARFTNNLDAGQANVSISSFPSGTQVLYTVFNWEQITPGTLWQMRWLVDGSVFYDETVPWGGSDMGQNFETRLTGRNGIPDGTYTMELFVNNVRIEEAVIEAEVGIGQLAIDPFAQTTGVQLTGQIIDSSTQEGIPGITFLLISEDFSVSDFVWTQEQVYATAVTDRNGRFQLDRLLQFDAPYSVIIVADGYLPIEADAVTVTPETENPMFVQIPLTRND